MEGYSNTPFPCSVLLENLFKGAFEDPRRRPPPAPIENHPRRSQCPSCNFLRRSIFPPPAPLKLLAAAPKKRCLTPALEITEAIRILKAKEANFARGLRESGWPKFHPVKLAEAHSFFNLRPRQIPSRANPSSNRGAHYLPCGLRNPFFHRGLGLRQGPALAPGKESDGHGMRQTPGKKSQSRCFKGTGSASAARFMHQNKSPGNDETTKKDSRRRNNT